MPKPLRPTEGGRLVFTDGGFGGGASGGGSFVGNGVGFEFIKLDSAFSWASPVSSSGSCALGISERKSRSSVDRAIDLRSDPVPLAREKRFKKRETADGAGATAGITISEAVDELATGDEGMKTGRVRAGEISRLSGAWGFVVSTLEREGIGGDRAFSTFASAEGIDDDALRFQNESNPAPGFLASVTTARSSFSRIRHPTGASSTGISFLALTDFSQSIDPLELRRRAIGLLRVKGICLVSLSALFTAFAVAVCENCIGGDKVMSSGTKSFNKTVMF